MKLEELEKLADAATPGPWKIGSRAPCALDPDTLEIMAGNVYVTDAISRDATFIAAANPQTVKQLIALCKLQHEVISKCMDYQDACTPDGYAEHTTNMRSGKSMDWTKMRSAQRAFNQFEESNK